MFCYKFQVLSFNKLLFIFDNDDVIKRDSDTNVNVSF